MSIKRWTIKEKNPSASQLLAQELGLSEIVCDVLVSKGFDTPNAANQFISEEITFESPFNLIDMDKAVDRITQAMQKNEKIAIYGDYDCDGITSTALLMSYFQALGGDVFYYIPNRETEGYGLNHIAVGKIKQKGASLIITVDNGITSHEEITYANSLGMDVIVTDHHTPRETLPDAVAVVNPHRKDCPSKFKDYAGVGVAFQLVCALEGAEIKEMLSVYSDLVTIGTIADIVPLVGENRAIVKYGLAALPHTSRPGIHALFEIGGISTDGPLSSDTIAFGMAPRLNAAGRMGEVEDAVELLITDDFQHALTLGDQLQDYNQQRRSIEDDILKELEELLAQQPEVLKKRLIIVSGNNWHPGVMGIVASRLLDQYGKPCLVFSVDEDGKASGSGRSLEGFNLIEAIHACSDTLLHYGGHTMAAGATLMFEDLDSFNQQLQAYAAAHYDIMPVPSLHAAAAIDGSQLTLSNVKALDVLGPFGCENEAPLFALENVKILALYPTRDGNHMRLKLDAQGQEFMAIYFRMPEELFPYEPEDLVDVVVALEVNLWNGQEQLSVRVEDLRIASLPQEKMIREQELYQRHRRGEDFSGKEEALLPNREQLALIYRYLRGQNIYPYGPSALFEKFIDHNISYGQLRVALDAFEELGLIEINGEGIEISETTEKVKLEDSVTLQSLQS